MNLMLHYYNNQRLIDMTEYQLIRRLLGQQELKEQLELEKKRLLQGKSAQFQPKSARIPNLQDRNLALFSYSSNKKSQYKYIPNQIDSKIAAKQAESIINTWTHQNQYFPNYVILRNIQKQSKKASFQKELTSLGKQNIEEILMQARKSNKKKEMPSIKEKYQSSNYKRQQSDNPFQQITIQTKTFQ